MAINGDVEKGGKVGLDTMKEPFIEQNTKVGCEEDENGKGSNGGSMGMVFVSTFIAVCGSFEFGSCFSLFGSIITIGAMIGAITSGHLANFIGRKGAMRMSAVFCITGWLAIYLSKGALLLDVGRFFTGYRIGVFSYVVPIFIAEIAPKTIRGGLATLNQLMIVTGSSVALLTGTLITWKRLALTGIVLCIFLLLGLFFIPESPRWLAKVCRKKEFEVALWKLRGKDADISDEAAEIEDSIESIQYLPKASMTDLFQSKYIRSVIIGVALMVFQQFGGINGVGFYVSQTFESAGISSGKIGTVAYASIQVPITILGAILMDKSGRRPLLMVSATGTCIGCFLTGVSFYLKVHELLLEWVPMLTLSGVLLYIGSFSIGMGPVHGL